MFKPLHTMVLIRILLLVESYNTTNYEPCRSAPLQLGVVLQCDGEGYTQGYSLYAFLRYKRSEERANRLSSTFKAF